jgi:hypothetical protein
MTLLGQHVGFRLLWRSKSLHPTMAIKSTRNCCAFQVPTYLTDSSADGSIAHLTTKDVEFFRRLPALVEARERAARVLIRNMTQANEKWIAGQVFARRECFGIDWLARAYTDLNSDEATAKYNFSFSRDCGSAADYRAFEDLQTRLYFTLKWQVGFLERLNLGLIEREREKKGVECFLFCPEHFLL